MPTLLDPSPVHQKLAMGDFTFVKQQLSKFLFIKSDQPKGEMNFSTIIQFHQLNMSLLKKKKNPMIRFMLPSLIEHKI